MIVNLPDLSPKRIATFDRWTSIIIKPQGPIRIGSSPNELQNVVGNSVDGLALIQPINNSDIFQTWWLGDLWMVADGAGTVAILITPGATRH